MVKKPRIVIIGSGPCGLGAAWRLFKLGYKDFIVYEKEQYVGGLATSFIDKNGFTWDVGGHVLHSHYSYFDTMFEEVMDGEYFTHRRESWIWIADRFVPYPFQNNIHRLPPKLREECLLGLKAVAKRKAKPPKNFAEWIISSFGKGVAKCFLLPYNRKVWAYPPEKMNYQWVGDRVAIVDIDRIELNIKNNRDDVLWGPNAIFHFPKHGGTGNIWAQVAKRFPDHIITGKKLVRIDIKRQKVRFADGTVDEYDVLLTTLPLNQLIELVDDLSLPLPSPLHYSRVTIVGLGVKGETPEHLNSKCWMYFPENIAPFFRATVFSNYSHFNAPNGSWSLMTEISSSKWRPLPKGDISELVIEGAHQAKLLSPGDKILSRWVFQSQYGYPTPTLGRDAYVHKILQLLGRYGVYSRGRFGAWKYEVSNQDHTFMQGVEWVNRIILGEKEVTWVNPKAVNAKKQ